MTNFSTRKIFIDARSLVSVKRGTGLFLEQILRQLAHIDRESHFYLLCRDRAEFEKLGLPPTFHFVKNQFPIGLCELVEIPLLCNFLIKADVTWFPANNCAFFLGKRIKVIGSILDIIFNRVKFPLFSKQWLGALYRRVMSRLLVKRAQYINTISQVSKKDIASFYKVDEDRIFVTYCSFNQNTDDDASILDELGLKKEQFFYTISGTAPHKNLEKLLKAFSLLKSDAKNKCAAYKLVVSGAASYKMDPNHDSDDIIITPYISELKKQALLKNCALFVFISSMEGFGIPPLEALMQKRKVLVSDIPIFRELYEDAVFYTKIDKTEEIARAMVDILDELPRPHFNFQEKFSWEESAKTLLTYFKS